MCHLISGDEQTIVLTPRVYALWQQT